jgi:hypothetical protein
MKNPRSRAWHLYRFLALAGIFPSLGLGQESPHGELSIPCENCHSAETWKAVRSPMAFDHSSTEFPLVGQHSAVSCRSCHRSLTFRLAAQQCRDCHVDVHRGELGATCERCHTAQTWLISDMPQRHSQTRFALLGAHRTASCRDCHVNQERNEYRGTPTECYSCHRQQYEATLAPAHAQSGIGTDCIACHTMDALRWSGGFNHASTAFPLTGAHATVACSECHKGNRFRGTPTQCVQCHQGDYNATADPAHASAGFSTACVACHTTMAWHPAAFDHNASAFPLTGAHAAVACTECHKANQFKGTPTQCVQCHQGDYNATTDPAHASAGFSTACVACHTTMAWHPAAFDHNTSAFPLTGAHAAVACTRCHTSGYKGTPVQCYSCHQQDYTASVNPPHASQGFPTDCQPCHSTSVWRPSTFQHDGYFPISAGSKHAPGRWTSCTDCHQVSGSFQAFSCTSCHAHIQTTMDSKHSGVRNYQYNSQACYQCHPRGGA